jgi:hypothetical protein
MEYFSETSLDFQLTNLRYSQENWLFKPQYFSEMFIVLNEILYEQFCT